ncbi:glycosyltransferase family 2 protein [Flavobacterium praedii]|uniref:glycosyltransferase family 2 protein n=1 Tax=Flavobacterium praedii TaxID=3002900 RepID=UPI002481F4CC|nr:glycosyltransferase family 2 protein [Flavobacterium praedii]
MHPILSIIIPCYNSEATLESTLESVLNQDFQEWEAIIVNDGSIDLTEEIALKWANRDKRFKYFSKQNEGLGKTRNFGILKAKGKYILPLDSDNLVANDFAKEAIAILENNNEIGVVHGDAEYFGEKSGLWKVDEFEMSKMLIGNYIDACAIYRKKNWVDVGGYDENMPYQGHEDWGFWIALGVLNVEFYHLNKITFKYRVTRNSMIHSFTEKMLELNNEYVIKKYSKLYQLQLKAIYHDMKSKEKSFNIKLRSEKFVLKLFLNTLLRCQIFRIN